MKCPFLEEMVVQFCAACAVKKRLPKDSLVSQNPCEAHPEDCPIYQELINKRHEEVHVANLEKNSETSHDAKPCIWMKAGVIAYRMCTRNYDCKNCEFDREVTQGTGESPMVVQAMEKLRQLPASEKKCRYMLTGDFTYKICSNNYECWHCAVDQYIQDTIDAHPMLQKRRQRVARLEKKVKGFTLRKDFTYLRNHIWLHIEGDYTRLGIDDFAAHLLGSIDAVQLPQCAHLSEGDTCWHLHSGNRMLDMQLSIPGEIVERNTAVHDNPSLIRTDPYNRGWLLKMKVSHESKDVLQGDQAIAWLEEEFEKLHQEFEKTVGVAIADGGELVEDIPHRLSDAEWKKVTERFLK
jgi:glycine cleavage system H lipoate-binding protein